MRLLREVYYHVAFFAVIAIGLLFAYGLMTLPRTVYEAVSNHSPN